MDALEKNEVQSLIALAFKYSNTTKLFPFMKLVYDKFNFPSIKITLQDIEKLIKLSHKEDVESSFIVGVMMNIFLSYRMVDPNHFTSNQILDIANSLIPIYERLKGMVLCKYLWYHVR